MRGYVHQLYRHLAACDLAIVQGGLSTCMELTANRRPFLYVPLRHHFEQNFHVRHRLDQYGAGGCMDFALSNTRDHRKDDHLRDRAAMSTTGRSNATAPRAQPHSSPKCSRERPMDIHTTDRLQEQSRARYPDEEGYAERDGVKLFYEVFGTGEPTVLLVPTWEIVHSRSWKFQIPYLARHCRVVTFDPRGNGRSDRPAGYDAYRRREFADDAVAVLDAAGVDRAIVVNWCDMGESLILAAEHPERVASLVFIAPPLSEREQEQWSLSIRCRARHRRGLGQGNPQLLAS